MAQVVYYLSRGGNLEQPHMIDLRIPVDQPHLLLRDVKNRLAQLRGKAMADAFCWSFKRNYRNNYIWHDLLTDDDVILPLVTGDYVIKGSQIFRPCQSVTCPPEVKKEMERKQGDLSPGPSPVYHRLRVVGGEKGKDVATQTDEVPPPLPLQLPVPVVQAQAQAQEKQLGRIRVSKGGAQEKNHLHSFRQLLCGVVDLSPEYQPSQPATPGWLWRSKSKAPSAPPAPPAPVVVAEGVDLLEPLPRHSQSSCTSPTASCSSAIDSNSNSNSNSGAQSSGEMSSSTPRASCSSRHSLAGMEADKSLPPGFHKGLNDTRLRVRITPKQPLPASSADKASPKSTLDWWNDSASHSGSRGDRILMTPGRSSVDISSLRHAGDWSTSSADWSRHSVDGNVMEAAMLPTHDLRQQLHMQDCLQCGRTFKPESIKSHMRGCHVRRAKPRSPNSFTVARRHV